MFYLVIMVTYRQTNRQTDKQTNAGKNIIPRFRGDNHKSVHIETVKQVPTIAVPAVIAMYLP